MITTQGSYKLAVNHDTFFFSSSLYLKSSSCLLQVSGLEKESLRNIKQLEVPFTIGAHK